MLDMMLHQMLTLLMAGIGLGGSPMAAPSPMLTCPSTLTVSATISNGVIQPKAAANNGSSCTIFPCNFSASPGSVINVVYVTNGNQFEFEDASNNVLQTAPISITTPTTSGQSAGFEFAVTGANNGTVVFTDPKITVTAGGCTTSL